MESGKHRLISQQQHVKIERKETRGVRQKKSEERCQKEGLQTRARFAQKLSKWRKENIGRSVCTAAREAVQPAEKKHIGLSGKLSSRGPGIKKERKWQGDTEKKGSDLRKHRQQRA